MSDLLGTIFRFIIEVIIQLIIYIIVEITVELLIMPILRYFFGRTRWFSALYIAMAIFAGYQLYRTLYRMENPSAQFYSLVAGLLILVIAPLIHERIVAVVRMLTDKSSDIRAEL
jgi:hypothetical protein